MPAAAAQQRVLIDFAKERVEQMRQFFARMPEGERRRWLALIEMRLLTATLTVTKQDE
jgi:hypothetical protein